MLRIIPAKLRSLISHEHHEANIQRRFIIRVLTPPFLILLALGLVVFWQIDVFVRSQAVSELDRSATTTAAKLEREFALRQTVLKRTGEELFIIKTNYQTGREKLDKDRSGCSAYLKQKKTFAGAPDGACDPFLTDFASKGQTQQAIESGYVKKGEELIEDQNLKINERLAAYKQFFPETLALLVVDEKQKPVSSALSNALKSSTESFLQDAISAQQQPIEGRIKIVQDFRLGIFAYPIKGGSVLAAYDLNNDHFIKQTWDSTPIDRHKSLALILDSTGQPAYPNLKVVENFTNLHNDIRTQTYINLDMKNVNHIAVGAEAGSAKWLVVVASPAAVVLEPLRNAQLVAFIVIGIFLLGFLWVGTFFIQRTIRSILGLVGGAVIFASGKLDHKINLPDSDREFIQLADTMNKMAERIAAAEKEIDEKNKEFISVATHELRTPLTAIIGNLSMVSEEAANLDPEIRPLVDQAFGGTIRLRDLINDMLDVARLEGGRTEFDIKPQNIQEIAKGVVDNLQVTAKEKNITLSYLHSQPVKVMADESRLRIILNNFVSNAIKYNRPKGSVTVAHKLQSDMIITSIADTGLGIPEDQKDHMFEKFFRVKNDDRKDIVGTGLGMYITKQYILAMRGNLWFESTHGKGTTFYFSLPVDQPANPMPTPDQLPAPAPNSPDAPSQLST